jgi:Myotubularin-like phosphatase domain
MFPCSTIKATGKSSLRTQSAPAGGFHRATSATTHPPSTKITLLPYNSTKNIQSCSLPVYFVVPEGVVDSQLKVAAGAFRGNRLPVWSWGTNEGAALVRMADMLPGINDRAQENTMLERVRKAHPKLWQPQIFDLQKSLPNAKDVQLAFGKLREIASPGTNFLLTRV